MALPLLPIFWLDDAGVTFSATFWTIVIIYECIIWALGIYLEQLEYEGFTKKQAEYGVQAVGY